MPETPEGLGIVHETAPSTGTLIETCTDHVRRYANARIPSGRRFSAFDTEAWSLEQRPLPPRGLRLGTQD